MNNIKLITGTLETNDSLTGWIITSETAIVEGAEDLTLVRGDQINIAGDVCRKGEVIGNLS